MPFDYAEYQQKCNTLSTEQLQKEWENYTRQIAGGATSTATSVLFSPLTAGVSLVGLGLSAPRIHNARKKREIIEAGLKARGSTHNTRPRDVAGSVAVSGVIAGLTLGLATPGADMIAGEVAGKGAEYVASHVILEGAGAAVEHKHTNHEKKKGQDQLKMKDMQVQLNQYQGYQQQYVQGQGMQMQSVQGVQMQMGGFQPPGLTQNMQLPQPGILMQNQQQIQWQQQPGLQIPGMHQPQLQIPGLQPGMQMPPRPHSAAPNNQYGPPPPIPQQYQPPQQLPQYPQVQQPEKYLITVPNPQQPNFHQQQQAHIYPPEKTPAYTTNGPEEGMTPLPLYSQQPSAVPVETERAIHPNHIDIPAGPTMEEEINFLKARLLQMELEKRGMSATISSPCEISLDGPEPEPQKPIEKQPSVAVQEITPPPQENSQPQQQPNLHVETQVAAQPQQLPQQYAQPPASPHPQTQHYQPPPTPQQYAPPPAQSPPVQQYYQTPATPVNPPQQYGPPPTQPQQQVPQPQRQESLAAPPTPAGRPASPAPPQQQTAPIYQPIPGQQHLQPQYTTSPQQQYQAPAHIQRQDSGYYSQAPTPLQRPSSAMSSISSPINRHSSVASASYAPNGYQQHQIYNPQQQQQSYNPQLHNRSQSIASVVSPMSTPAPPPYFAPPPTGPQPVLAGKDYFNQGSAPPVQHPSFPNYAQVGVGGQRGSIAGAVQGWQWSAPPQPGMQQQVGGEPNYGAPPPIPGVWRSS